MKRVFGLILICAFASAAQAQSRRIYRVEPPPQEAGKSETKGEAKDAKDAKDEARDEAKEKPQDEAQAGDDDDKPLRGGEVRQRANVKSKPNPKYPPEARTYGVRGEVKLRLILGADGKIGDKIEVLRGLPHGVTEEAIKAARKIKFEPARIDGRPVSQYVTIVYHFNLY